MSASLSVRTAFPGSPRLKGFTFGGTKTSSRARRSPSPTQRSVILGDAPLTSKTNISMVDPDAPRWFENGGGNMTTCLRGRHALDPAKVPSSSPGPAGYLPKVDQIKKRVTGYGFGASTASRGLIKSPAQIAADREAARELKREATKRVRARRAASRRDQRNRGGGAARRRSPSPKSRPMISTARRYSPLTWAGANHNVVITNHDAGAVASPGPALYGKYRNTDTSGVTRKGGRFGTGRRGVGKDPSNYLTITEGPGPAYNPEAGHALQLSNKPTFSLGGKLKVGSYMEIADKSESPGPKYMPQVGRTSPEFTFGGGPLEPQFTSRSTLRRSGTASTKGPGARSPIRFSRGSMGGGGGGAGGGDSGFAPIGTGVNGDASRSSTAEWGAPRSRGGLQAGGKQTVYY